MARHQQKQRPTMALTHAQRRAIIEVPINIGHYGGRSFAGAYKLHERDGSYIRYLGVSRHARYQEDSDGYLP